MASVTVKLEIPVERTFRVEQVAGMLDVPIQNRLKHEIVAEVPGLDEPWQIGAIVGPSGSGKTTLARAAFGKAMVSLEPWPRGKAIVDCLEDGMTDKSFCPTIKQIARVLIAVGLGSIPTWLKPYAVLSTGERFRADLARAVLKAESGLTQRRKGAEQTAGFPLCASAPLREHPALLVFDEFTSSLDRTIARTTSAALARFIRRSGTQFRFVAVTCHPDILPWLAPDWTLDLSDPQEPRLTRGHIPLPPLPLRIDRVPQSAWQRFKSQHYLAGGLAASATCYGAWFAGEERRVDAAAKRMVETFPIAFCAVVAAFGWKNTKRITRPVLLTLNVIVGAAIFLIYFTPTFLPFPFGHSGSDLVDFVNTAIPPALGALVFGGLDFWFDEVRQTRIDH